MKDRNVKQEGDRRRANEVAKERWVYMYEYGKNTSVSSNMSTQELFPLLTSV
jgi:hypothetical protein